MLPLLISVYVVGVFVAGFLVYRFNNDPVTASVCAWLWPALLAFLVIGAILVAPGFLIERVYESRQARKEPR